MTKDEFALELLPAMRLRWPAFKFGPSRVGAYIEDLEQVAPADAMQAFHSLYRDRPSHPPNGGEIAKRATELGRGGGNVVDVPAEPSEQLVVAWSQVHDRLRKSMPESVFNIWLAPLKPIVLRPPVLYLQAPDRTRDWIERRFGRLITRFASAADPAIEEVQFLAVRLEIAA